MTPTKVTHSFVPFSKALEHRTWGKMNKKATKSLANSLWRPLSTSSHRSRSTSLTSPKQPSLQPKSPSPPLLSPPKISPQPPRHSSPLCPSIPLSPPPRQSRTSPLAPGSLANALAQSDSRDGTVRVPAICGDCGRDRGAGCAERAWREGGAGEELYGVPGGDGGGERLGFGALRNSSPLLVLVASRSLTALFE